MSLSEELTISCSTCGTDCEVTVFHSINDSWPDAVNLILSGKLFAFTCTHCGREDHLEYDMLFNDFGHQAWIQIVHDHTQIPVYEEILDLNEKYMPGMRMRIVRNTNELREKVLAFSLGRDDRILELCKYVTCEMAITQKPRLELQCNPIYTRNYESESESFVIIPKNGEKEIALLDERLYNEIWQKYSSTLEQDKDNYIYDYSWAKRFLKDSGNNCSH